MYNNKMAELTKRVSKITSKNGCESVFNGQTFKTLYEVDLLTLFCKLNYFIIVHYFSQYSEKIQLTKACKCNPKLV